MNNEDENMKNIDYGIKNIKRLGKYNDKNDENQSNEEIELKNLEKSTSASIVKIEMLSNSRIILLCK